MAMPPSALVPDTDAVDTRFDQALLHLVTANDHRVQDNISAGFDNLPWSPANMGAKHS